MLNAKGWEIPDPKPRSLATGLRKPPSLEETIARVMRSEQAKAMLMRSGVDDESDEDREDFDIPDDPIDALTNYEFAADAVGITEMKSRLVAAISKTPTLADHVRDLFGHLFKNGELRAKPIPPAPKPDGGTPPPGGPPAPPKPPAPAPEA